jgi:hypothetical protein
MPLKTLLPESNVHYILEDGKEAVIEHGKVVIENGKAKEQTSTACLGSALEPKAVEGNLCVYEAFLAGGLPEELETPTTGIQLPKPPEHTASTTGTILILMKTESEVSGQGTWAVTAPKES